MKSGRLNKLVGLLEQGSPAFINVASPGIEPAIALAGSVYDGVMFELEHRPFDLPTIRDSLQYLLDRRSILEAGSALCPVTPIVRIPPNGGEMNQWIAKQVLDLGAYGIVWPHVSTVEQAFNAVAACRYPRPAERPRFEPAGQRGDGPGAAARYWGVSTAEYYRKADVWPLDPDGEVLVILMIEDGGGVRNLADMLDNVPGIGGILFGDGDLSQELGAPRQYDNPAVVEAKNSALAVCRRRNIPIGVTRADGANVERLLEQGYSMLFSTWEVTAPGLMRGRELAGRS